MRFPFFHLDGIRLSIWSRCAIAGTGGAASPIEVEENPVLLLLHPQTTPTSGKTTVIRGQEQGRFGNLIGRSAPLHWSSRCELVFDLCHFLLYCPKFIEDGGIDLSRADDIDTDVSIQ